MVLKIGFAKASGFAPLAWAVEVFGGTPYSHIYFRWMGADGVERVFETTSSTGTTIVPIATFLTQYTILEEYGFNLSDADVQKYQAFCAKYQGTPYGIQMLVGIGIAKIFGLKKNPLNQSSEVICAELLLLLMQILPDVFVGEQTIKENPSLVDLKVLHDFIAHNPAGTRIA